METHLRKPLKHLKQPPFQKNRSFDSLQNDFILSDCLDFVHAGVEAIIEDEVTQRFVAEELKVFTSQAVISVKFINTENYMFFPSLGIF